MTLHVRRISGTRPVFQTATALSIVPDVLIVKTMFYCDNRRHNPFGLFAGSKPRHWITTWNKSPLESRRKLRSPE